MEEQRKQFDVCIVSALPKEAQAVVREFSERGENVRFQRAFSQKNRYVYQHATLKNDEGELLTVLVMCMPFTGPTETVLSVRTLLEEFQPRFVAMTGICAGYRKEVALGDLVAASYAFHYEQGKGEAGADGEDILRPEWRTHGPTRRIVQYLNTFTEWEPLLAEMKRLRLGRELQHAERPKCLVAPIASGMAVQANNPFPRLLEHNRKALFLDQEVAAFYQTLQEAPDISFLAVKGVCDYADALKNDDYHDYAARAAAVYMLAFIQQHVTKQTVHPEPGPDLAALRRLDNIIQNFKSLGGQIADYAHLRGEKGFNVEVCESRYNLLYEEAIVFLATYLPERVADDAEGFAQTVHRRSIVELQQRSDLFVSFTRWVISPLAKLEKLGALVNACTATLESYRQKYFPISA